MDLSGEFTLLTHAQPTLTTLAGVSLLHVFFFVRLRLLIDDYCTSFVRSTQER